MELVGDDGHKVTYTRKNVLEETPIGGSIPGLHLGVKYQYTLKSDCGLAANGQLNSDCEIDHRISLSGRRLEMEDMMLEGTQDFNDLILTLDPGFGTFAKTGPTTGTLTIPDECPDGKPTDPCKDVECPECHECVDGKCVDKCPDGICDEGVCIEIPPTFPGNCDDSGNGDDCPTSLISFFYRDNKYGIVYDNEKIQTVWITGAGNPEEATIWIRFKLNICKVDCDSFCLPKQGQSAAGGYIFDADIECEVVEDTLVKVQVNGKVSYDNPPAVVEGYFIPSSLRYECCFRDCEDIGQIPPYVEGDNGDCDNRPDPNPVPDADKRNKVYLYDRLNHTYVFCCPIRADVTWLLPFDTLPPVFQRYITTSASVRTAAQLINNPQLFQLLKDREQMLRMECQNYELEQGDLNYLNQPDHSEYYSYQVIQTLNR